MASPAPRYARAFAEVTESAKLDAAAAQQQLNDFAATLAESAELRELLENPSIEMASKLKVLDALAPGLGLLPLVRNFIGVILEHHRLNELNAILDAYRELIDAQAGAVEAKITSFRPLNPEDRAMLEQQVAKLAGARIRASYAQDESLLGGAVVEIGSTIYDGSLRAQLDKLRQKLVNA